MQIDSEVRKILDETRKRAEDILSGHRDQLDALSEELLRKETLDDAEIRAMLGFGPASGGVAGK